MQDKTLTEYFTNYLDGLFIKEHKVRDRKFYVSDMGGCKRMRWFKRKGVESAEMSAGTEWVLTLGNLCHDFAYKVFESQGVLMDGEFELENEHFKGRADAKVKDAGEISLGDIKSIGGYKMKQIHLGTDDEENIRQVLTYLVMAKDLGSIYEKGILFYLNKEYRSGEDTPAFLQKNYYLTTWREKQIREEMEEMTNYWVSETIPKCTCPAWKDKKYNSFYPICKMSEDKLPILKKTLDKGEIIITSADQLFILDGENRKEFKI